MSIEELDNRQNDVGQRNVSQRNDELPEDGEVIQPQVFTPLQGKIKKQGFQLKTIHIAVGTTLLILASVAIFLFTAKSVFIVTDPPDSTIIVSDGFAIPLGEGYLMHAGEYTVSATAGGYYSLDQTFTVSDQQNH